MSTPTGFRPSPAAYAAWWAKDAVETGLTRLSISSLSHLPESRARWLARRLAPFFSLSAGKKTWHNPKCFFESSNWSDRQFRQFHSDRHDYLARLVTDFACLRVLPPQAVKERITFIGTEHVQAALAFGRGVLILCGHTGSFPIIPVSLSLIGNRVSASIRPVARRVDEKYFTNLYHRFGVQLCFVGRNARQTAGQAFARNEIFLAFFDVETSRSATNWLPFGPVRMKINPRLAELALEHHPQLLYASARQLNNGSHLVTITPANPTTPNFQQPGVEELCTEWLRLLGQDVASHPAQWWMWPFQELSHSP